MCIFDKFLGLPVWHDRIRGLTTDYDIYVVHCWLINPNKLNLRSWLLTYLSDKHIAWHQHFKCMHSNLYL